MRASSIDLVKTHNIVIMKDIAKEQQSLRDKLYNHLTSSGGSRTIPVELMIGRDVWVAVMKGRKAEMVHGVIARDVVEIKSMIDFRHHPIVLADDGSEINTIDHEWSTNFDKISDYVEGVNAEV